MVINGVNENEGKGKNRAIEPCFTVRVLNFARETKHKLLYFLQLSGTCPERGTQRKM